MRCPDTREGGITASSLLKLVGIMESPPESIEVLLLKVGTLGTRVLNWYIPACEMELKISDNVVLPTGYPFIKFQTATAKHTTIIYSTTFIRIRVTI
jgi:hypothetical protein